MVSHAQRPEPATRRSTIVIPQKGESNADKDTQDIDGPVFRLEKDLDQAIEKGCQPKAPF